MRYLRNNEAVDEAVSFAIPDELYGQEVGVAIVLKPDSKVTEMEFRRWVLKRLSAAKAPKRVSVGRLMSRMRADWSTRCSLPIEYRRPRQGRCSGE